MEKLLTFADGFFLDWFFAPIIVWLNAKTGKTSSWMAMFFIWFLFAVVVICSVIACFHVPKLEFIFLVSFSIIGIDFVVKSFCKLITLNENTERRKTLKKVRMVSFFVSLFSGIWFVILFFFGERTLPYLLPMIYFPIAFATWIVTCIISSDKFEDKEIKKE